MFVKSQLGLTAVNFSSKLVNPSPIDRKAVFCYCFSLSVTYLFNFRGHMKMLVTDFFYNNTTTVMIHFRVHCMPSESELSNVMKSLSHSSNVIHQKEPTVWLAQMVKAPTLSQRTCMFIRA